MVTQCCTLHCVRGATQHLHKVHILVQHRGRRLLLRLRHWHRCHGRPAAGTGKGLKGTPARPHVRARMCARLASAGAASTAQPSETRRVVSVAPWRQAAQQAATHLFGGAGMSNAASPGV